MELRKLVSENQPVIAIVALIVIAGVGYYIYATQFGGRTAGTEQEVYFYDLETGERFLGRLSDLSPADAPSGPGNGVRVHVFGCGSCAEENLVNGYLERLTPEGLEAAREKAKLTDMADVAEATRLAGVVSKHTQFRAMDGGEWVPADSDQGRRLVSRAVAQACSGTAAMPCVPGQKSLFVTGGN